jgi:TRAP-type C4-dicarboxylate transport system substrate-binding protein
VWQATMARTSIPPRLGSMITTSATRIPSAALALALAAVFLAGCTGGTADKAGGSGAPTVLRLGSNDAANQPDTPVVRYFAAQVEELSGGSLRVDVLLQAAGNKVPNTEGRIVQKVRDGQLDLGWIGARAWDRFGVTSFQALQAPFLITDYTLLHRVATSPLAGEMLAGLERQDVVGLALVPDLLRHPVGMERPLVSLADFEGARLRDIPSNATDALLRALGATPAHLGNAAVGAGALRRVDGQELSLGNAYGGTAVTGNVTFFGKALTLFAGRAAFEALTDEQQNVLREAAARTLQHVVATPPSESALARRFCAENGRIVLASGDELAALVRAAQPVYTELERDAQTKRLIAAIRQLKATTDPDPPLVVPAGCSRPQQGAPAATGTRRPPSIVNGTYHVVSTRADMLAFGPPASDPENLHPGVDTRILNNGKWLFPNGDPPRPQGTYTIRGNRITFTSPGRVLSFTFSRDSDGTLHLKPVLPMDRGDQWVMAGERWQRVGPPREIR